MKRKTTTKRVTKNTGGKSTVNKAGNYTKPTMRKNLFNRINYFRKLNSKRIYNGAKTIYTKRYSRFLSGDHA